MLTLLFAYILISLTIPLSRGPSPLPVSLHHGWDEGVQYLYSLSAGLGFPLSSDDLNMRLQSVFTSAMMLLYGSAVHAASRGCGKALPRHQDVGGSYSTSITTEDGRERSYIIHIPSNYNKYKPVPVIFSFHGRTRTAEVQEKLSQFSNEKWNPNAIAVYPQGIKV